MDTINNQCKNHMFTLKGYGITIQQKKVKPVQFQAHCFKTDLLNIYWSENSHDSETD